MQAYARVSKKMIDRYGNPDRTYEKGSFEGSFVRSINNGSLVRILEWDTPQGVMRFGIPQRYDGRVRMELQHANKVTPIGDNFWSVNSVR